MFDAGSWSEPIVISDDEDEAYVERELELEQRLSSPRGHFVAQLDDWGYDDEDEQNQVVQRLWDAPRFDYEDAPDEDMLYGFGAPVSAGSKRKRTAGDASFSPPPPPPPGLSLLSGEPFPPSPKKEAKNKKKRRKREEAERFRLAGLHPTSQPGPARKAGPSFSAAGPTPQPPPFSTTAVHSGFSSVPFSQPTALPLPLKPFFVTPHLSPPLPPPILSNPLPYTVSLSPPVPLPMALYNQPKLSYTRSPPMSAPAPVMLPIPPTRPQPQPKGIIGRPPAEDLNDLHGSYPVPLQLPLPEPTRTLIMDPLPKKYRNVGFVRWWAMQFGLKRHRSMPLRIELHNGKALIEFPTPDIARTAFRSPRIYGEGKEHVRVWWYKVDRELEEGEIDEDGDFHPKSSVHPAKPLANDTRKTFQQAHEAPRTSISRPPLSLVMPRPLTPPAEDPLMHHLVPVPPSRAVKFQPSTVSVPSPMVQSSSVLDDRATSMDIDSDDDGPVMRSLRAAGLDKVHGEFNFVRSMDLPASASQSTHVADRLGTYGVTSVSTDAEKTAAYVPSPTSTETSTVVASASTAGQSPSPTLDSTKTTPTPPPAETSVAKESTKSNDVLGELLARKRELEEQIQGKLNARIPRSADATSLAMLPTSMTMTTTKEDDLRKLVLESKKTRGVGTPTTAKRTVTEHVEQPLSSNGVNLSDLAVNFIAESIKTVSPLLVNAPSPPQLKPPSPEPAPIPEPTTPLLPMPQNVSKPSTAKAEENEKLQKLQQEIALCKRLMSKMEAAKKEAASQTERDRLLREMRSRRENNSVMWAMSSNSSGANYGRMSAPRIIWPSTTTLVLEISDDEDDEEE